MIDLLAIGLKTFVSVLILYYAVNTFWRYHLHIKRVYFLTVFALSASIILVFEPARPTDLLYYLGVVMVLFISMSIIEWKTKRYGYVLFNVFPRHYSAVYQYLQTTCPSFNIPIESISYCAKKPYLIVFHGLTEKQLKPFLKQFELDLKRLSPLHPWNVYLTVILSLILLAAYWRYW
jgi:hypothetical protein